MPGWRGVTSLLLVVAALVLHGVRGNGPGCKGNSYFVHNGNYMLESRIGKTSACTKGSVAVSCNTKTLGNWCVNEHYWRNLLRHLPCGKCYACPYSSSSACKPGYVRKELGVGCDDLAISSTQSKAPVCVPCGNSVNGEYVCTQAAGYWKTGTRCTGSWFRDTQSCDPCTTAGAPGTYECAPGYWKNGAACNGLSTADTQTCAPCALTCPDGSYISEPCSEATSGTVRCTECGPYTCPDLHYKTGVLCNGTSRNNTQTCAPCAPDSCAPEFVLVNFTVSENGTIALADPCDGTGTIDTMDCVECELVANLTTCPNGTYALNSTELCAAGGRACVPCGNGGANTTYVCPPGEIPTGVQCNGTVGYDTQACAPAPSPVVPVVPDAPGFELIHGAGLSCLDLVQILLPLDITDHREFSVQRVLTVEGSGGNCQTYVYTIKDVFVALRGGDCIYHFASGALSGFRG